MPDNTTIDVSNPDIILDLESSSDAKEFEKESMLHAREFENVKKRIGGKLKAAAEFGKRLKENQKYEGPRLHDTITISGPRGSGKTSFLLTLREHCKKEHPELVVLDIIDPTLIEDKGHVFLNIISLIKDKVAEQYAGVNTDPNSAQFKARRDWEILVKELADGIPSIDGIGTGFNDVSWQDPTYVMEKGLKAVSAAQKLEENFKRVVANGLEKLNKTAFLIMFDDIDIDFKKGWMVLETIRKYLTSPQLIILLSGDVRLYSMVIRKHKWENFGEDFVRNETRTKEGQTFFNDKITEMESQYLQKVLNPEYRFYLPTMLEKTKINKLVKIKVKSSNAKDLVEIKELYRSHLNDLGIKNNYQVAAYSDFLLNLPLRTQIRLLTGLSKEEEGQNAGFINAFLSDLYEKRVDVELAKNSPEFINIIILNLLVKEKALSDVYQLQPTSTDHSLNSSLVALSILFSNYAKHNPSIIFDYIIRIGLTRNLLSSTGYADDYRNRVNYEYQQPTIEGLCKHAGLFQNKVLRDICGLMNAYASATVNTENRLPGGTIPIYGTADMKKTSKAKSADRIDYVFSEKDIYRSFAYFPFTSCKRPTVQNTLNVYSVYTLFGAIGELLKKVDSDDIINGVRELSEERSYPSPDFGPRNAGSSDAEYDDDSEENEKDAIPSENNTLIGRQVKEWASLYPEKSVSPHLLGKISTRMFYAFEKIQEREAPDKILVMLGAAMHMRIIAMLNAILIEDVKENIPSLPRFTIDNTVKSPRNFLINLRAVRNAMSHKDKKFNLESISFSRWMLSCPLLLVYLNPGVTQLRELLGDFCGSHRIDGPFENSIFKKLELVSVK